MFKVRTRYAPSPTGIPHIGNIRTALFNFLFAKNQHGEFLLRIEDTDRKRLVPASIEAIQQSLKNLGIYPDDKYLQSERLKIYKKYLEDLKRKKVVYLDDGAFKFKVEKGKTIKWHDSVHGKIEFKSDVIEDFVVIKSDGFPTYHFASVIDDHEMEISHVIRGDEWISSTPKHLLLYEAFKWQSPQFVHVPPIVGTNKKKLSKRDGAKSVLEYLSDGYLPEALNNFLALLGWSPKGNQEIFSLQELIENFSLERLNKNSPIFNIEKLKWFNGQWIRKLGKKEYITKVIDFFPKYASNVTQSVAPLTQDRIGTLLDYSKIADFFYNPPNHIPTVTVSPGTISNVASELNQAPSWRATTIKEIIEKTAENENIEKKQLIGSVRNIVAGTTVTPPLYESLEKLGKPETVKRLDEYAKKNKK